MRHVTALGLVALLSALAVCVVSLLAITMVKAAHPNVTSTTCLRS